MRIRILLRHDCECSHPIRAVIAHLDSEHRSIGSCPDRAGFGAHRAGAIGREEVQDDVGSDTSGHVLGREVDE